MFGKELYESTNASKLFSNTQKYSRNIKAVALTLSERTLIQSILYMLLGKPSQYFVIRPHESSSKELYFIQANQLPIQLSHLSSSALNNYLQDYLTLANQILYIRYQTQRVYSWENGLLRNFTEGVTFVTSKFVGIVEELLRRLQREAGNVDRTDLDYQESRSGQLTLLTLKGFLQEEQRLIGITASALTSHCLAEQPSSQEIRKSIVGLMNLYYQLCDRQYCYKEVLPIGVHGLFGPLTKAYLQLSMNWLQMNEKQLTMNKGIGFFVELGEAYASGMKIEGQGKEGKQKKRVIKLLEVSKLVKDEWVPKLFQSFYQQLLELGKTIQFIKLYFNEGEKLRVEKFVSVREQFQLLFVYIRNLSVEMNKFITFFQRKNVHFSTLSDKLAKIKKISMKNIRVQENNPYGMHVQTQGVFVLQPNYNKRQFKQQIKPNLRQDSEQFFQKMPGEGANQAIERILKSILSSINKKCLNFFSQAKNGGIGEGRIRISIDRTLKAIRKYILFQQGDFLQELLQSLGNLLERPSEKIARSLVISHIEEALRATRAGQESSDLTFKFLRQEGRETGVMKGWRTFALILRPQGPQNSIFTQEVMEDYGSVSNLLFNLKRCEYQLIGLWSEWGGREYGSNFQEQSQALRARNAAHHIVTGLLSYLLLQVDILWSQFLQSLRSSVDLRGILECNEEVLGKLNRLTFDNWALCNCLVILIKMMEVFRLIRAGMGKQEDIHMVQKNLKEIWQWHRKLLEQARQIQNFSQMLDLNSAFTRVSR